MNYLDVGVVVAGVGLPAVHHHAHQVVLVPPQQRPQARQQGGVTAAAALFLCLNMEVRIYDLGINA